MAHFAELDKDNKVLRVIVISNENTKDENGIEKESIGVNFCKKLFGEKTKWIQTSYSGSIRKIFAGVGFTYNKKHDIFVPPSPGEQWIWDDEKAEWVIQDTQLREILEKMK